MNQRLLAASAAIAVAIGGMLVSAAAPAAEVSETAGGSWTEVVRDRMDRWPADAPSNSGHTVVDECGESGWPDAVGRLKITQTGTRSRVTVIIRKAKPDTLYTVWVRLSGTGPGGGAIGPNPMTGGGATALLPGDALDTALAQSPPLSGTDEPGNGFTTDERGKATWSTLLDFPLVGGSYPFHRAGAAAVQDLIDAGSGWPLVRVPAAIVDPAEPEIDGPFFIRVVSHCQDGLAHGLSPANRETWFQYP